MTWRDYDYKRVVDHAHPRGDRDGHVLEHILIAERALGRYLPLGAEVHHVDGNPRNNANRNLVICQDKGFHKLLHLRARVRAAGGNPNTDKICSTCKRVLNQTEFNHSSGRAGFKLQSACRECQSAYTKTYIRPSKRLPSPGEWGRTHGD
jgi:hypothetical protein